MKNLILTADLFRIHNQKVMDTGKLYLMLYGNEELKYINPVQLEWFKIRQVITDYNHIGVLVPPEIQIQDKKDVITGILENYSIPYEYNEVEQVFVIYGYK